jgi:hypothetical protein
MTKFAIVENNQVTNIIVADDAEIAVAVSRAGSIAVEYTDENPAGIGWTYDGTKFVAPIVPEVAVPNA